jgi:energy-coupling factor transporter ATP-binding protein EcfA2
VLRLEGVSFRYPGVDHEDLHAVSLELAEGTVTGLTGPADAGKSTLCLVASGLAPRVVGGRLVGTVSIDGADVRDWPMHRLTEQVVMGLQDPIGQLSLIADTVRDEVAFGPANLGLPRREVELRTTEALQLVGIEALAERDPRRLSVGQQQLVVMAGLLALRPRHLILDGPVAHLDARSAKLVLDAVAKVAASGTAVLIAERLDEAVLQICDSIGVITHGNLVAQGSASEVFDSAAVRALGIEPPRRRIVRRLREAGLDPALLESAT